MIKNIYLGLSVVDDDGHVWRLYDKKHIEVDGILLQDCRNTDGIELLLGLASSIKPKIIMDWDLFKLGYFDITCYSLGEALKLSEILDKQCMKWASGTPYGDGRYTKSLMNVNNFLTFTGQGTYTLIKLGISFDDILFEDGV